MDIKRESNYYIFGDHLIKLTVIRDRLYTEKRMSGDDLRNTAQILDAIISDCKQLKADD